MVDIPQIKLDKNDNKKTAAENSNNKGVESVFVPKLENFKDDEKTLLDKEEKMKQEKAKKGFFKEKKKLVKIVGVAFVALLVFVSTVALLSYRVYKKGMLVKTSVNNLAVAAEEQNLEKIKLELSNTEKSFEEFGSSFKTISWLSVVPYVGEFVKDAGYGIRAAEYGFDAADIFLEAIEPYADIIGLDGGSQATSGQETAQERLDFVIKSIPDLIPKAGILAEKMHLIKMEVDQIDPDRYPAVIAGYEIRNKLEKGIKLIDMGADLIVQGKPLLESAPYILGSEERRTYVVLFQNDKELRPTGGFITAYSVARVDKGRFEPVFSSDIYNLDNNYSPSIAAPDPIIKHLKGPYLISKNYRLRDMNWSPDFSQSMELFLKEARKAGMEDVDGVIAVDTQLLVNILDALGPIDVSGYGRFSTEIVPECNCPQVIYELESFADIEGPVVWSENEPGKIVYAPPNYDNRKKIIGPLMNSILSNALGQSKENLPALFEAAIKSLYEKHVLFYMKDDKAQKAVESFGIAGRIREVDGDYLYINDANLGGRKSNLYVTSEVNQEIEIKKDGSVIKTLTITYNNPEKQDGWLNSVLPNYVRIYVPKGSEFIDMEGLEEKEDPYEEFGKSVFAGFFKLRPQGISKVIIKYKLPFTVKDEYGLYIQKQPGTDGPLHTLVVGKNSEEFFLKKDEEFKFRI